MNAMSAAFETTLQARTDEMLSACTKCGKCFEACPITAAAGIADADPQATIAGVLDIVRTGDGPEASRKWASSCVLSGECIKVCDDGANPRPFLPALRLSAVESIASDFKRTPALLITLRQPDHSSRICQFC